MKIVALVLAGGEGTRLYPLTAEHAKPALPFANGYRICDFVLSNLVNSNISTIYVLAQYKPESLMQHVQKAWSPWFEQSEGLIKVLLPRSNTLGGQFKGTADAVAQYLDVLQAHSPDLVAVFAADHIYRMDVRQMIDFHRDREADVTVSALAVPREAEAAADDSRQPASRLCLDGQLPLRSAGAGARAARCACMRRNRLRPRRAAAHLPGAARLRL
jgi:glucose-1-phosphate adenylyltransferase